MKNLKSLLIVFSACMLILVACEKENSPTGNNPVNGGGIEYSSIQELVDAQVPEAQLFTINANFPQMVHTAGGTRIKFAPLSFMDSQGNLVSGNIQISVEEYYNVSDMFFAGLSTTSQGELLISGGQFNITATQNGETLQESPNFWMQGNVPVSNTSEDPRYDMMLFDGTETADGVEWLPSQMEEFWVGSDSSFSDCGYFYGSLEIEAGESYSFTYNEGSEDPGWHSINITSTCGTFNNYNGTGVDGVLTSGVADSDCLINVYLSDIDYDGWVDANIDIVIGTTTDVVSVPSDDCEPSDYLAYNFYTEHMNWINCDYFANSTGTLADVVGQLHEEMQCGEVVSYMKLAGETSIGGMQCDTNDGTVTFNNVPEGTVVWICCLAIDNDQLFCAFEEVTVATGLVTELNFSPCTITEFETTINGL